VTSDGFKESGREMIGVMLQTRISDGEVLAYDRIDPDPSPKVQYAEGTGQLFASPRFAGSRGTFPDGLVRPLSTKLVYACGQHGIVQASAPKVQILLIGVTGEETEFLQCVRAGVRGYLPKSASAEDVVEGVASGASGRGGVPWHTVRIAFPLF